MAAYETEIRAVQTRIAEIERDLEARISMIQQEAHRQIMTAIRTADDELFPARLFLSSVATGAPLVRADEVSKSQPEQNGLHPKIARGKTSARSRTKQTKNSSTKKAAAPKVSVRTMLLEKLAGAEKGVPESEIDAAVAALGLTKDASRKAKGFAKRDGLIEEREGLLVITAEGRAKINGLNNGG